MTLLIYFLPNFFSILISYIFHKLIKLIECDPGGGTDDFMNKSNGDLHCYQFLFTYNFVCGVLLNIAILITYLMSVRYTRDLIRKGMKKVFNIDDFNENDPDVVIASGAVLQPCCNIFGNPLKEQFSTEDMMLEHKYGLQMSHWDRAYEGIGWGLSMFTQQQYLWCLQRLYVWRQEEEEFNIKQQQHRESSFSKGSGGEEGNEYSSVPDNASYISKQRHSVSTNILLNRKTALQRLLIELDLKQGRLDHANALKNRRKKTFVNMLCCGCIGNNNQVNYNNNNRRSSDRDNRHHQRNGCCCCCGGNMNNEPSDRNRGSGGGGNNDPLDEIIDMSDIFINSQPDLFFKSVDLMFLLNTFYSAFYFTQILPICVKTEAVWWGILQGLPMIIGFSLLRFTLLKSVFLQAVVCFDDDTAGRVIENSIESLTIANLVRERIIEKFSTSNDRMTNQVKLRVVKFCFQEVDKNNSGSLDKTEFREFLGSLEVYLTKEKFDLLYRYIDSDNSSCLSRDEVLVYIFPEMKSTLKEELKIIKKIRKRILIEGWTDEDLKDLFGKYDQDESGTLEIQELKNMLVEYPFSLKNITPSGFKVLMAAIDTDHSGNISWNEFLSVCRANPNALDRDDEDGDDMIRKQSFSSFVVPKHPIKSSGLSTAASHKTGKSADEMFDNDNYDIHSGTAVASTVTGKHDAIQEADNEHEDDVEHNHENYAPAEHDQYAEGGQDGQQYQEEYNQEGQEQDQEQELSYQQYEQQEEAVEEPYQQEEEAYAHDATEAEYQYPVDEYQQERDEQKHQPQEQEPSENDSISFMQAPNKGFPTPSSDSYDNEQSHPSSKYRRAPPPGSSPSNAVLERINALNNQSYVNLENRPLHAKSRAPPPLAASHRGENNPNILGIRSTPDVNSNSFRFPWSRQNNSSKGPNSTPPQRNYAGY